MVRFAGGLGCGTGSRCRGGSLPGDLQEPERLVEFEGKVDLGIAKDGESGIHLFGCGFLELVPAGIAAVALELDQDAFPCLEDERTGQGRGGHIGSTGKFLPFQFLQEALDCHAFPDLPECSPRQLHYV
jgi:hypothetical protein